MEVVRNQIMQILLKERSVNKSQLAERLSIRTGKLDQEIVYLNNYLQTKDLGTILDKNNSYVLKLTTFSAAYNLRRNFDHDKSERENRPYVILSVLLENSGYVTINDLADVMYLSPRQISSELIKVRKILGKHDLTLKSVPRHGLIVEGKELNKRVCFAEVYASIFEDENDKIFDEDKIRIIRDILIKTLRKHNFKITDYSFENLVVHLYISIIRVKVNYQMTDIEPIFAYDDKMEKIAKDIVSQIEERFSLKFSDNEYKYVIIHLQAKQNLGKEKSNQVPFEIYELVNDFLRHIDENYNTELRLDIRLCMTLALHFEPFISRVKYGFNLNNPLLKKIQTEFIYEYELAEYGCKYLESKIGSKISTDEIGYLALDIKMSLDDRFSKKKSNILLICSTGRGTAELLRNDFENHFDRYIGNLDVCSYLDAYDMDLDVYDYIFSTVPVAFSTKAIVVQISYFIDEEDVSRINDILDKREKAKKDSVYFPRDLFMGVCDFKDKNDALKKMTDFLGLKREIPDDFLKYVKLREKMACTSFGNEVAMPHPSKLLTSETFVCVAISKKPLAWYDDRLVRVILLTSIENTKNKNLKDFYRQISRIVRSEKNRKALIDNPTYETLCDIIEDRLD